MTVQYRADQVGSFLRPAALLEARKDPATRPERLRELEDRAILECLARQRDLGFEIFTDGELRRSNFMSDFWDAVAGLDHGDAVARMWQVGAAASPHVSAVTGIVTQKLRQLRRLTGHERRAAVAAFPHAVARIEVQVALELLGLRRVGGVAPGAVLREHRADLLLEEIQQRILVARRLGEHACRDGRTEGNRKGQRETQSRRHVAMSPSQVNLRDFRRRKVHLL